MLTNTVYQCGCKVLVSHPSKNTLILDSYPCAKHEKYSLRNRREISLSNRMPVYVRRNFPANIAVGGFDCDDKDALNDYVERLLEKSMV